MRGDLTFDSKSFCFTGKMAELKRTQAEREARARGGLTTKVVNRNLDHLVVGSIPASGWKFGKYGRKIEAALNLRQENGTKPMLISEAMFMDALAAVPAHDSGDIDEKVLVVTYSFTAPSRSAFDSAGLNGAIEEVRSAHDCHVRVRSIPARVRSELFGSPTADVPDDYIVFELRFVRVLSLDGPVATFVAAIEDAMVPVSGVDGDIHWFERVERVGRLHSASARGPGGNGLPAEGSS